MQSKDKGGVLEGATPADLHQGRFAVAAPVNQPQRPWLSAALIEVYESLGQGEIAREARAPLRVRQGVARILNDQRYQTPEARLLRGLATRWGMDPSNDGAMLAALFAAPGVFQNVATAYVEENEETGNAAAAGNVRAACRALGQIASDFLPFPVDVVFLNRRRRLTIIIDEPIDRVLRDLSFTARQSLSATIAEGIALAAEKFQAEHGELLDHKTKGARK
jgi:hypothetical protein